jgi:ankyrin repeat protein
VEILLDHNAFINAPAVRYKGLTALQGAALGGHYQIVQRLLKEGADVNAQGSYYNGYTALAAAAEGGHYEIVQMLLNAGADVSAASGNKTRTAAQIASFRGQENIVQLLQQFGQKTDMAQVIDY